MGEHPVAAARLIRFGPYEFDSHTRELRRNGFKLKLAGQPIEVLAILLERPGELVTREELQSRLWPNDTVVEFEHSINTAVKRVREVLEDSAGEPRFVETLPRRGYRFIAPAEPVTPVSLPEELGAIRAPLPEAATDAEMTGERVGRFRVLEKLGGGGMGVVYKAEDTQLGRTVAIKFLPAELASDRRALERFQREARAASALDHPNICTIHEIGEHAGRPFIVMPLIKGRTLKQLLGGRSDPAGRPGRGTASPLPTDTLLDLGVQIADALEAAHSKGIIHRDIKPGNVLVTETGQAKVLDFGLAKLLREHETEASVSQSPDLVTPPRATGPTEDSITRTGVAVGTPAYMSPEQVRGEELDTRTDLFSFGATLYEMATGIQPFAGETPADVEQAILTRSPTSLRELNRHLPPKLESIIAKALERDRDKRYPSAADLRADLVAVAAIYDRRPSSDTETAVIDRRYSRRVLAALAATLAAITIALAAYWFTRPLPPPRISNPVAIARLRGGLYFGQILTDGTRVYFGDYYADGSTIMQVPVAGGEAVPLPTPFRYTHLADISPDRSELLIAGGDTANEEAEHYVLPILGGSIRRLDVFGGAAAWSPDGQKLIYSTGSDLYLASRDGTNSRKLVTVPGEPGWLVWSPDGRVVRFNVDSPTGGGIWEVSADGSNLHGVLPGWTGPGDYAYCGAWTRDGKYYVFHALRQNKHGLWAIREDGGVLARASRTPTPLITGPLVYFAPLPSVDGKKLFAFSSLLRFELMRFDTKTQQFVPHLSGIPASDLDFSRDGQWVAYAADYTEESLNIGWMLFRSRSDGSQRLQLTFPPLRAILPRWSPDGKQIVFVGLTPGKPWKIYLVSTDGGTPQQLISDDRDEFFPQWSPDGNRVLFVVGGSSTHLNQFDLRTKQISTVPGSEGLDAPNFSYDGRYVAARADGNRKLVRLDLASHQRVDLATTTKSFGRPLWSHDGTSIYVWADFQDQDQQSGIYRVRLSGHKMELVASYKTLGQIYGASGRWYDLAPDDSLLVTRDHRICQIYAFDWEAP